jgi:hypothetical protein
MLLRTGILTSDDPPSHVAQADAAHYPQRSLHVLRCSAGPCHVRRSQLGAGRRIIIRGITSQPTSSQNINVGIRFGGGQRL